MRLEQIQSYIKSLDSIKLVEGRIEEVNKTKSKQSSKIKLLELQKDEEIKKIELQREKEIRLLREEKQKKEEIRDTYNSRVKNLREEKERVESSIRDYEKRIEEFTKIIEGLNQDLKSIYDKVSDSELEQAYSDIRNQYNEMILEALSEKDKLTTLLKRKKLRLKSINKMLDKVNVEEIVDKTPLGLHDILLKCKVFDNEESYLKRIKANNWIKWKIPIIIGIVFLLLSVAGIYIFKWTFLNVFILKFSDIIWWVVESVVFGILSCLVGYFLGFLWKSELKKIPFSVGGILLFIIACVFNDTTVLVASILAIIFGFITGIGDYDIDIDTEVTYGLSIAGSVIIFILQIICFRDIAYDWVVNIIAFVFSVAIGGLTFWSAHILFTKTSCCKIFCNMLKCNDILQLNDSLESSINIITILYYLPEIIELKIGELAKEKICQKKSAEIYQKISNSNGKLESARKSLSTENKNATNIGFDILKAAEEKEKAEDFLKNYSEIEISIKSKYTGKIAEETKRYEEEKKNTESAYEKIIQEKETNILNLSEKELGICAEGYEQFKTMFQSYKIGKKEEGEKFRDKCNDSDDILSKSEGALSDKLYYEVYSQKSEYPIFEFLNYGRQKMVLLYDKNEIENGKLSHSLFDYVGKIIEAFWRVNPERIVKSIHVIDTDTAGNAFAAMPGIRRYFTSNDIDRYLSDVKNIEENKLKFHSIENFNRNMIKVEKKLNGVQDYTITFILYGDFTRADMNKNILWSFFSNCEASGVIPIFFIEKEIWENVNDQNGIKENAPIRKQVPKENIYYISREKHGNDVYIEFKPYTN